MTSDPTPILVVSAEQIAEKQAEIARLDGIIADAGAKKDKEIKWLEAVGTILGRRLVPMTGNPGSDEEIGESTPVTDALVIALKQEGVGRTQKELSALLQQTPLRSKVKRSTTIVSTALSRLTERGKIVRHRNLYYESDIFQRVLRGELSDDRFAQDTSEPDLRSEVLDYVAKSPRRVAAGQVLAHMKEHPLFGERVRQRPNAIYNVLARLLATERLVRVEGAYAIAKTSEAPADETEASTLF